MKKVLTEFYEQKLVVEWINCKYELSGKLIMINNGGKRSLIQNMNLKKQGLEAGASDLFLAYPCNGYHGLWIEMKQNRKYFPSEKLTQTWQRQKIFQQRMRNEGYCAVICYGFENAIEAITDYIYAILYDKYQE